MAAGTKGRMWATEPGVATRAICVAGRQHGLSVRDPHWHSFSPGPASVLLVVSVIFS